MVKSSDLFVGWVFNGCGPFYHQVYQENVWREKVKFSPFKKVFRSMGSEYDDVQLVSFNSISKGFFGE